MEHELDERSRVYEVGVQMTPTLGDEGAVEKFDALKARVLALGGTIIAEGAPERIDLAYPMYQIRENKKTSYTEAYFAWYKFEIDASQVKTLESELLNDLAIIRQITFKTVRENTYIPRKGARRKTVRDDVQTVDDALPPLEISEEEVEDTEDDQATESILDKKLDELTAADVE